MKQEQITRSGLRGRRLAAEKSGSLVEGFRSQQKQGDGCAAHSDEQGYRPWGSKSEISESWSAVSYGE